MAEVQLSGNADIDGILWGYKWDQSTLTYSFPTSASQYGYAEINGFEAFNVDQRFMATRILESIENFTGLNIDITTGGNGDIRFGEADSVRIEQGDDLIAVVGAGGTPPDPTQWPAAAHGDMWFNHDGFNDPQPGAYGGSGMLHEIGHAFGLKHGHAEQQAHGQTFPELPANHDSPEYSVMTYSQYVGDADLDHDDAVHRATTFMQDDIAALQYMYGANYDFRSGSNVYSWNPSSGEMNVDGTGQGEPFYNYVLMTVWDGGGIDTYNFVAYNSDLKIDLAPGAWTTLAEWQLADLGSGHLARGNIANALLYQGDTSSLIENAIGGTGDDSIKGNQGTNVLKGGRGEDNLDGRAGFDVLQGGEHDDTYVLNDVNLFYGDAVHDIVTEYANEGTDTVLVKSASVAGQTVYSYTLGENIENGIATGPADFDLTGNSLDNQLTGNGASNELNGANGNDRLLGGGSGDILRGGNGNDTYKLADVFEFFGTLAHDVVTEQANQGIDTVEIERASAMLNGSLQTVDHYTLGSNIEHGEVKGSGSFHLTGNSLGNWLTGNTGANELDGEGGHDRLDGGAGRDILRGGANNDWYILSDASFFAGNVVFDSVIEQAGQGIDTVQIQRAGSGAVTLPHYTLTSNVENGIIAGSLAFDLTGNALGNALTGNIGANILDGGAGSDILIGGGGNDTFIVDNAGDLVAELAGEGNADTIMSSVSFNLANEIEILELTGNANIAGIGNHYANTILGNSGSNHLDGGFGADTLQGRLGNDSYYVDNAGDTVKEETGEGTDIVFTAVSYALAAGQEIETLATASQAGTGAMTLTGNGLGQRINGNNGSNILYGGAGDDLLVGYGGNDNIEGQNGLDTLKGVSGADKFVFRMSTVATSGADHIADFGADDFVFFDHPSVTGALNSQAFVVGANALDANDRFLYEAATGNLWFDQDGNAAAAKVLMAVFDNKFALTAADIILF